MSARLRFRSDEIGTGLFQALGTRLLDGRFFTPRDGPESPGVVIVKDALARQLRVEPIVALRTDMAEALPRRTAVNTDLILWLPGSFAR